MLSRTEAEYVVLSECAQEVNFVSIILGEMTKVKNSSVTYEYNQGAVFLVKNRHVGIRLKILIFVIIFCGTWQKIRILISSIFGVKITLCKS